MHHLHLRINGVIIAAWTVLLFLVLPLLIVLPVSLTPERYLSLPNGEISLRHYITLFSNRAWLMSISQSLFIAAASTTLAVGIGTACAIGLWRIASPMTELIRMLTLVPIIVPLIVSAIGFYRLWAQLGWLDTYTGVIIAYTVLSLPYVVIAVSAALANFDLQLEQAARSLGASPRQAVFKVILPNIVPGIVAGAIFAFIQSWDEVVVALFITSRYIRTLPRHVWEELTNAVNPTIAAVATILCIFTTIGLLIATRNSVDQEVSS